MRTRSLIPSHFLFLFSVLSLSKDLYSQNVGIGTTSPTGRLQINHRSSTIQPGLLLQDSTTAHSGLIRFNSVTSAKYMQLWGYTEGSFSAGQYLDISSDSTFVATFRGNGNFGLGVFTPAYRLDVNGVINSASEYRLFGKPIFRWGDPVGGLYRNFSIGDSAGFSNSTGFANTFIGGAAGILNTAGYRNCFFGSQAGYKNVGGHDNTYIGSAAGLNSTGSQNTFLGSGAGISNAGGANNTFLGNVAGSGNISGIQNTFLGSLAGFSNQTGSNNVFVGQSAGDGNTIGDGNTLLGVFTDLGSPYLINATAIGYQAYVTQANSLVLGSINGINGATDDTRIGIGTTAPTEKLDIVGNIKVSGEVNRPATGTAHLLPIAFGSVTSGGGINSGSANFTVTRTAAGSYTIDITDHSYSFFSYSTVVTVVGGPLVAGTDSFTGNLLVRLYNLSGVLTDSNFHFVVYRQ